MIFCSFDAHRSASSSHRQRNTAGAAEVRLITLSFLGLRSTVSDSNAFRLAMSRRMYLPFDVIRTVCVVEVIDDFMRCVAEIAPIGFIARLVAGPLATSRRQKEPDRRT